MRAANITGPKHFEIQDIPLPVIESGQCLVKLENWSVCGSDIRMVYGPLFDEEKYPMKMGDPCHELSGTIVESRSALFKEGQRVIVLPDPKGTGGLVEYISGHETNMVKVPDEGDLGEWTMCQPAGTVLYSCQQIGTIIGKNVLILGQGGIGLSFTDICSRAGARQIITTDLLNYRLGFSKTFGATHTINPSEENIDNAVKEITGGEGAEITIEAAGYQETLNDSIRLVSKFGKVIIFGLQESVTNDISTIRTNNLMDKTPTIIPTVGNRSGDSISHIKRAIELKQRGWWNPGQLITHRLKFNEVNQAYDMYENYTDEVIKVVMEI